jgi:putative ABC transport system permease protein
MPSQLSLTRILRRSLVHRRARSLSALVAMTVSAGVATALLTLYADLDSKLHKEFRSFGANIVVTIPATVTTSSVDAATETSVTEGHAFRRAEDKPAEGVTALPKASLSSLSQPSHGQQPPSQSDKVQSLLAQVQQAAGPDALVAPFAYAVATTDRGTSVVVAGTDFDAVKKLNSWWQVKSWPQTWVPQVPPLGPGSIPATSPSSQPQALLGQRAAQFIGNEKEVTLIFKGTPITLQGAGRLTTGGDEDSRIYIPLAAFTQWTGTTSSVIEVQVPGGAAKVEAALTRLRAIPGINPQPVRQLVEGESRIVDKTHALMYGAVLLIALTVAVSVLATLSASVLERRRDFALMKALGGSQTQLVSLFLLEALLLAIGGVAAGFIVGSLAAWAISEANFHTASLPRVQVIPIVLLLNVLIAAMAAMFPARVLRGLQPAALLKGD